MARLSPKKAGFPRAYRDHRTRQARAYAAYVRRLRATLGPLPDSAALWLREAGRAAVELDRLSEGLEAARARRRVRLANGIRRQQNDLRQQLLDLEDRLANLAAPKDASRVTPEDAQARLRAEVERLKTSA